MEEELTLSNSFDSLLRSWSSSFSVMPSSISCAMSLSDLSVMVAVLSGLMLGDCLVIGYTGANDR